MEHQETHKSSWNPPTQEQSAQFAPRPFAIQAQPESTTQHGVESQSSDSQDLERASRLGHSLSNIAIHAPAVPPIQAKLTIGAPGDKYEQEADRVAAQVVRQINAPVSAPAQRQSVQRQEESEEKLQAKPSISHLQRSSFFSALHRDVMTQQKFLQAQSTPLQRREAIGGGAASANLESAINSARGSGQPLDMGLQQSMGQAMGADFSDVKVHADAQSDQLNRSIQAKAFTTGKDVFFRQGAYQPESRSGQELIAHELTHVVQQNGGAVQRSSQHSNQLQQKASQRREELVEDRSAKPSISDQNSSVAIVQRKLTEEQIKHANRIRKARGLPPVREDKVGETEKDVAEVGMSEEILPVVQSAPKSIEEFIQNAASSYTAWIQNKDSLLDILLGPFEANWFKAKACLTMDQWPSSIPKEKHPPHAVGIKVMQALVDMRTDKWKAFTDSIKPEFTERMKMYEDQGLQSDVKVQEEKKRNLLDIFDSVGAQAVTSDVDLSSGGSNSELGVQFINSKFRLEFAKGKTIPYDPGTVFDINVYASDWIHGEAKTEDTGTVRTITPKAEVEGMSAKAEKERTKRMEVWSLVKVRRNMSPKEWVDYTRLTLDGITDQNVQKEMEQKLLDADFEYQTFKLRVETKQHAMEEKLKGQEEAFFKGRKSAFDDNNEYQEDAHFTRAANAIYEETLAEVKILRLQINQLKAEQDGVVRNHEAISNLGIQLGNKIAEALTYANEVYATEGAVQHTVLKQGAGKKLTKLKEKTENSHLTGVDYNLKPELYLQSVNENVGDSLHSINHFQKVPHYAVYRAGKYLSRLCDAAEQLLTPPGARKAPFYEDLDLIGKNAVRVKAIKVEDIEGDPEYVKQDKFFKDYDGSNLSTVREEILKFGAAIPQLFNEKKRADEEQQRNVESLRQQQLEPPPHGDEKL